ncbi:reverse transcriptase domain-containing protein [Tanacetum coccineum]|uniref:Reverse transcriptase domain-containing protein n=1 Tax=Tanacetum coccineum TaxID=301880 RepID=A0ABQ4XWL0_9ASTR
MDASSKKFKYILHFNTFEEGLIFYDDMTYSMLLEFVVKRFNLDTNVRFNLSFNLPAIERDITNDDDVEFFIDCATNSITDEIPHLYIRPPKVEARIIPGPEYVRKVNEDVSEDDHFMQGTWLQAIVYLHGEGVIVSGCLGDMKKHCIKGKLELVVGVVKSCTPNLLRDMTVTLKDPTGTMGGTIDYKVFQNENDGYTKSIKVGSVLILRNVSVWTPKPSQHYLNITIRNIVKVRIFRIHMKTAKTDKYKHENGRVTQEAVSKEAQGLQEGGIAKLAIRVTYLNPRATIKDANSVGDLWLRLKERLRG